ncbi:MAG: potassium uptake protein, TrkH family [Intestinimonas sp.]|nr:potassium uptake protein, TrkH family [Intestinimonas sp.]
MQERLKRRFRHHRRNRKRINPTRVVAESFGFIILVGTLLLMLPVSSRSGLGTDFITCLFTATSATCVTGLVLVDTWLHWSIFGQIIILCLIQLGGLGFMTIITLFSFLLHRRIGLSERLIIMSTLNLNDMDGVVRMVRHVLIGTATFEGAGTLLLAIRFVPRFGWANGLWRSLFHAVSAFCNAGFDLMGSPGRPFISVMEYADDPLILFTIITLVVMGGLGFFVWEDVWRNRNFHSLRLYSKVVLVTTAVLVLGGTAYFFFAEYNNAGTLGGMPVWEKLMNAMFQSVTLRTAGFNTIDQAALRDSSQALCVVFMLIGGSSGSTAGGVKTVTVVILLLALRAGLRGSDAVTFHGRAIPVRRVMNAVTLVLMAMCMFMLGSMAISLVDGIPFLRAAFETASAMGTVGLTANVTGSLGHFSRGVVILLMYTGRVGILSFSLAFLTRGKYQTKIKYPTFDIMIG